MITTIKMLVRQSCAGYTEGGCIDGKCLVLEGERCEYFEKAVLPPIDYTYSPEVESIPVLHKEYSNIHEDFCDGAELRHCECGRPMAKGKQLCKKCKKKRKQDSKKRYQKKYRKQNKITVNA